MQPARACGSDRTCSLRWAARGLLATLVLQVIAVVLVVPAFADVATTTPATSAGTAGGSHRSVAGDLAASDPAWALRAAPSALENTCDDLSTFALAVARFGRQGLAPQAIAAGDDVASSAAQGARLREHLRMADAYGAGGVRELADGRIRYYGELTPARKPGEMAGGRLAREWNPATDAHRTWYETLDHSGRIPQVHPYEPRSPYHYMFDELGNYAGRR